MDKLSKDRSGILFCLIGPAGCGKTSIGERLLQANAKSLVQSVSSTSRSMREGEIAGASYTFISRAEFEKRVANGDFVEWEEVHGNLYGTPRENIARALKGEIDVLLVIDIKGALNIKNSFPEATVITVVLPPSFAELEKRIRARGKIGAAELMARLKTARSEYQLVRELAGHESKIDYVVVNHKLEEAVSKVDSILAAERVKLKRISEELLQEICQIN